MIRDVICVPFIDSSIEELTVDQMMIKCWERYLEWHPFKVYGFQLLLEGHPQVLSPSLVAHDLIEMARTIPACADAWQERSCLLTVMLQESEASVRRRAKEKQDEIEEAERRRLAEIEAEQRKQAAIQQIRDSQHWSLTNNCPELTVPLEERGEVLINTGSLDQWVPIQAQPIAYRGQHFFSVAMEKLPPTSNTWLVCIGWTPLTFKLQHQTRWIGSQNSYAYIAGTGGRCAASGQSVAYGMKFGEGDVISSLLDLDNGTIEFFKNEVSQGIAFRDVTGPLLPAISLTATGSQVRILPQVPQRLQPLIEANRSRDLQQSLRRWQMCSASFALQQAEILDTAIKAEHALMEKDRERRLARKLQLEQQQQLLQQQHDAVEPQQALSPRINSRSATGVWDDAVDPETESEAMSQERDSHTAATIAAALAEESATSASSPSSAAQSDPEYAQLCHDATVTDWWNPQFSYQRDDAIWYPDPGRRLIRLHHQGSHDKWRVARGLRTYTEGVHFVEVLVEVLGSTSNSWRLCVGVVPLAFNPSAEKIWIGAQGSYSYISGTGGKCHDSSESLEYGERFSQGDIVGILINLDQGEIEFFKNGRSQGVAFRDIQGPLCVGASFAGTGTRLRLRGCPLSWMRPRLKRAARLQAQLTRMIELQGNAWDRERCVMAGISSLHFDSSALTVNNTSDSNGWQTCLSTVHFETGRRFVELEILSLGVSSNTWLMCVGVVPSSFSLSHEKVWVGAQGSWGYIANTGGKCHNRGQSEKYGRKFGSGDRVGILMDFENKTLEFFVNRVSQGIAYTNLGGLCHVAVAMAGQDAAVRMDALAERDTLLISQLFLFQ